MLSGSGWYNLNRISYPESTLFKATFTATTCILLPKLSK